MVVLVCGCCLACVVVGLCVVLLFSVFVRLRLLLFGCVVVVYVAFLAVWLYVWLMLFVVVFVVACEFVVVGKCLVLLVNDWPCWTVIVFVVFAIVVVGVCCCCWFVVGFVVVCVCCCGFVYVFVD